MDGTRDCSPQTGAAEPFLLAKLIPNRSHELDWTSGCETWGVAFSPDGSYFAWSQGHNIVKLVPWPLEDHKINSKSTHHLKADDSSEGQCGEKLIDCGQTVWGLSFGASPSNNRKQSSENQHKSKLQSSDTLLATGLTNGEIKLWKVPTAHLLHYLKGHQSVVRSFAFITNEDFMLVSASRDRTLRVWDLKQNGKLLHVLNGHNQWVYCCAVSPDSTMLCSVGGGRMVLLWSTVTYTVLRKLEGHGGDVVSCEYSSNGALLATASYDTYVIVWDPYTGESLMKLRHCSPPASLDVDEGFRTGFVRAVSFSQQGLNVTSVADDGLLRIWCLNLQRPIYVAPLTNGLCCTFSPHGSVLATGTRDGHVTFWTVSKVLPTLQHICRNAVRHMMTTHQVMLLSVPKKIKQFLIYKF
ncbi:WD repeat and SOCS box-containing protein 2 isoform X1 [Chiloscyllium plagiosum]|uniref:WD repeat and SOCS box-containing protein 2 isoform X1 n=1 Tax=Chiloscyllium plagiosum TaxID=36176 RepID=UPI001CB7E4F1|nr:WD repeat and SOCS box-containing protein 2 isoform X1 [Chiloscyllium plagiosum]XP_043571801.1 WD repeat and SOCS box-containing protein 2 isoform X1 [Chiloscyllium plagiosum]XP_043571803.1 WD repeat and SOCS box-containing protein 2 isoform X1 [Chiloscyllium plagiosum]